MLLLWSKSLHARFTALPAFCCCFCGVSLHAPDTVLLPWSDMACVWYFTTFVLCQYMHLIHTVLFLWSVMVTWYSVASVKWHGIHLILYRFCAVSIHALDTYSVASVECHDHLIQCRSREVTWHTFDTLPLLCCVNTYTIHFHCFRMSLNAHFIVLLLWSVIACTWYFTASM